MPPRKFKPTLVKRNARAEALKRLRKRVGEDFDPSDEPIITPLLKAAEGGIPRVLEALRAHDEEDARDFLETYDDISAYDRTVLTLEEIAHASGIGSIRLLELCQSAIFLYSQNRTKILLSAGLPSVVARMMKQAVKPSGYADREWALKSGGILPTPKGAQILIQNNNAPKEDGDEKPKIPEYLDPEQRLRLVHEAVEQRRLPAPASEPVSIGGKLDHIQAETAEILVERD